MQENPYYWWHQCLKLTPPNQWGENVKEFLSGAEEQAFEEFWEDHGYLFEEEQAVAVRVLEDEAAAKDWLIWDDEDMKEAVMVISLDYPVSKLVAEFERHVKALKDVRRGKPKRESMAEFPLCRAPNLPYIERLVGIYQDRFRSKPALKLAEIAIKWSLAPQCDPSDAIQRNVMTAIAGRLVKQSSALVKNASNGIFPSY